MNKRLPVILVATLLLSTCLIPIAYAGGDSPGIVLENMKDISLYLNNPNANNLPDVVVTYKDGVCTIQDIPDFLHPEYGENTEYSYYENGGEGIFLSSFVPERSPRPYNSDFQCVINVNKSPITYRIIDTGEYGAYGYKVLSNGITATLNINDITLYKSNAETLPLQINKSVEYKYLTFNVDYSSETKQYAVIYAQYQGDISTARKQVGIAMFTQDGRLVKQTLIPDMYFVHWSLFNPSDMGFPVHFYQCAFSEKADKIYLGGIVDKATIQRFNGVADDEYYGGGGKVYEVDLTTGVCRAISEKEQTAITKAPDFPFTIEYNQKGTSLYINANGSIKTLTNLNGDYIAASYEVNQDSTYSIIFVSERKSHNPYAYKHSMNIS